MNTEEEIRAILRKAEDGKHSSRIHAVDCLEQIDFAWTSTACVHILRNYTLEPLEPFLKLSAYRIGVRVSVSFSNYDTYQQDVLDPSSLLYQTRPDVVLLSLWLESLPMSFDHCGRFQPNAVIDHVAGLIDSIRQRVSSMIALNTFLAPSHALDGGGLGSAMADSLATVNAYLTSISVADNRLCLVDFGRLLGRIGVTEALDPRYWFMFKAPFKARFFSLWGETLGQVVGSLKGRARKVLVLDCDNTLWGGIVGEDGIEGIKLSAHDYPGNVFYAFQRQIIQLQNEGVLLALCSKNNENDVMEVLESHPACLLKRDHLVGWRINWDDKVANLVSLAKEFKLGLDSFVFIDDDDVESQRIREALPMVEVLQVPHQIYELPSLLGHYAGFRSVVLSAEDSLRTAQYQSERDRERAAENYTDRDTFLASLSLVAEIGKAKAEELPRVSQLTQKTNQFNLTTRRYGPGEIETLASSQRSLVLVMSVSDRYGDYGLTGVAILENERDNCRIDTFLMSCRILGRHLEAIFLDEVIRMALKEWQPTWILAEYIRSQKNSQVAEFYSKHGFECTLADGSRQKYRLRPTAYEPKAPTFVQLRMRL